MNKHTVLIVEDDRWLAEQYKRVISSAGYGVIIAGHGLEAIQLIDDTKPDAIILDVLLTGSTAFTLMHELQSYEDTGSIPIIICTNLANELSIDDLKPYGVKRLLDKSTMVPGDLVASLKEILL
jgi:CheY-like chemotaxis protein